MAACVKIRKPIPRSTELHRSCVCLSVCFFLSHIHSCEAMFHLSILHVDNNYDNASIHKQCSKSAVATSSIAMINIILAT